jgi:hypothetical protein
MRTPGLMDSSASGMFRKISDATSGDVETIPWLQVARRHPAGISTLNPSSALT